MEGLSLQLFIFIEDATYLRPETFGWSAAITQPDRQTKALHWQPAAPSIPNCLVTWRCTSGLLHSSTANSHFDNSGKQLFHQPWNHYLKPEKKKKKKNLQPKEGQACGKYITSSDLAKAPEWFHLRGLPPNYTKERVPCPAKTQQHTSLASLHVTNLSHSSLSWGIWASFSNSNMLYHCPSWEFRLWHH